MTRTTRQSLRFGPVMLEAADSKPAPYFLSGHKLYAIGTTSGALEPVGAEHLVGEMGGVWAHPVKFLDGWYLAIEDQNGRDDLLHCLDFEGHLSDVTMRFTHGPLAIGRTDFVAENDALLFSLIEIANESQQIWTGKLGCVAQVNILPTWFSGWERGELELHQDRGLVTAFDTLWEGRWGVVFGSSTLPSNIVFGTRENKHTAELRYQLTIQPGQRVQLEFLVACDHRNGHHGALQLFGKATGRGPELLEQKRAHYRKIALGGVELHTPDPQVNHDWVLAKANLLMLEADYEPYLPGFLLAGVPEYPQLFGCDNTYTTPGATAAGFATIMRSTLGLLGEYTRRACGRVPHEITTNGRVFNPGNTQETPQFAIAVWDYVRWTGDLAFLRHIYPVCREGVMDYLPGLWDGDHDGYPTGDAMVERTGMGSLKLDSACYLYGAWRALAEMAQVLQRPEAMQYKRLADDWLQRFEQDWWLPDEGLYADSLHSDYRPQLDGHWTQVVPIQLGIARPERAEHVLDRLEREFTNEWGLVHTRGREERVWTLPTGLLALAALRLGRVEHAIRFLNNISLTARYGMLGAFKELIPEGLCFVQLWSAGLYLQGWLEGVLGLDPLAHAHRLSITPALPHDWPEASVKGLQVGAHLLNINVRHSGCTIEQISALEPITIVFKRRGTTVATFATTGFAPSGTTPPQIHGDAIQFQVGVGQQVTLHIHDQHAQIQYGDRRSGSATSGAV
jgi:hypothetical protein